jgi:hypothetical protein
MHVAPDRDTPAPAVVATPVFTEASRSIEINELASALSKAQRAMTYAKKDSRNPFYSSQYADLASCWEAVREPLSSNGLALMQFPSAERGVVRIETILAHSSGQWIGSTLTLPVVREKKGEGFSPADDPQAVGSAITYGRRYAMAAIVGIAQDDDDAEAATGRAAQRGGAREYAKPATASPKTAPAVIPQPSAFSWVSASSKQRSAEVIERMRNVVKSEPDQTKAVEKLNAIWNWVEGRPALDLTPEDKQAIVDAAASIRQDAAATAPQ